MIPPNGSGDIIANVDFYELAGHIVSLHESGAINDVPAKTGMSRRKLYYLLEVGQLIRDWKISKAQAHEVGWTKLQIVSRHYNGHSGLSQKEVQASLSLAAGTTAYALREKLRHGHSVSRTAIVFRLSLGGKAILREALLAYGAEPRGKGMVNKEKALVKVAQAVLALKK